MANNLYVNKVVYDGRTLIDLSSDTVIPTALVEGYTAHDRSGATIVGTASGGSGDGYVWQDAEGYVHLSDEEGTQISVIPLSVSAGGTYMAPTGKAYSPVTVPTGSATTPSTSVTANPSISVNSSGLITATASATKNVTPTVSAGYVSSGTAGTITVSGSNTSQLSTQAGKTVTPTETEQTAVAAGKYTTGAVKVGAISSTYVGSGIDRLDDTDLTVSGATVTVPSGYYSAQASKAVTSGTAGTPTATKGAVSSNSISVTPSVTNSTGYITGGTKTGTAVTVTAGELVSGSQTITSNQTVDVTNLAQIIVNVSGGGGGLVYEAGTFVPTEDVSKPTISFANTHTEPPMFAMMIDASATPTMETYTQYSFIYTDWYRLSGTGFPYSATSNLRYGFYRADVRTSSTTSTTNNASLLAHNSDEIGSSSSYPSYFVTSTEFKPSPGATTDKYWRAGRTYKWIAVWAPTT